MTHYFAAIVALLLTASRVHAQLTTIGNQRFLSTQLPGGSNRNGPRAPSTAKLNGLIVPMSRLRFSFGR